MLDAIARHLKRHQARRSAGVPTVTLLLGDPKRCAESWLQASEAARAQTVITEAHSETLLEQAWLAAAGSGESLTTLALRVIIEGTREEAGYIMATWPTRTLAEKRLWLQRMVHEALTPEAARASRWLGGACLAPPPLEAGSFAELRAVSGWLPSTCWPQLCVAREDGRGLSALLRLGTLVPQLTLAAAMTAEMLRLRLAELDARARTLAMEGVIDLGQGHSEATAGDVSAGDPLREAVARARDARSVAERALAAGADDAGDALERARSLAERLLYLLLQSDPDTRELFRLNGAMPFSFGPRAAEVDLVCDALRLAVEVDGYHHFREASAYRRDRRKDVLMQKHGFLVSRYLASDVVERGEEVVASIKGLVADQRRAGLHARRKRDD